MLLSFLQYGLHLVQLLAHASLLLVTGLHAGLLQGVLHQGPVVASGVATLQVVGLRFRQPLGYLRGSASVLVQALEVDVLQVFKPGVGDRSAGGRLGGAAVERGRGLVGGA